MTRVEAIKWLFKDGDRVLSNKPEIWLYDLRDLLDGVEMLKKLRDEWYAHIDRPSMPSWFHDLLNEAKVILAKIESPLGEAEG